MKPALAAYLSGMRRIDYPTTLVPCSFSPENMISQAEFVVQKVAAYRHGESAPPVTRTLCLTDCLLIERDPISYRSICAQPLCEVCGPFLETCILKLRCVIC